MRHDIIGEKLFTIKHKYQKKRRWHSILSILSAVVVFFVAYALVLPAITLEKAATVSADSVSNIATTKKFGELDGSGSVFYALYVQSSNKYYAIDGNGKAVQVTKSGSDISWSTVSKDMFWTFTKQDDGTYKIQNLGTEKYLYPTSSGLIANDGKTQLSIANNSETTTFYGNGRYARYNRNFTTDSSSRNATKFYIAEASVPTFKVWYDGTNGGLRSLGGATDECDTYEQGQEITLRDIRDVESPTKYNYKLRGWYDIVGHQYYAPGEKITITADMLLYADWEAATYDVGEDNEHVVESADTNSFIDTHVFDYSAIFNMYSTKYTGSMSEDDHSESWSVVTSGKVGYKNQETMSFIMRDWDSTKQFSYPSNSDGVNTTHDTVTSGILSSRPDLIDMLFSTENAYDVERKTGVLGKVYVGPANYLYQYEDDPKSENYGYYYYDSRLNAASYNQSQGRFFIYDYLERTTCSWRNTGDTSTSDFMPFNSPYIHDNDTVNKKQIVRRYDDSGNVVDNGKHYMYDESYSNSNSKKDDPQYAGSNFWFGMSSDIEFYLPNDCGTGGNVATSGKSMVFNFSGDDDVWIFVDDVLVLDIGGIHGALGGSIDFSTGKVTVDGKSSSSLMDLAKSSGSDIDKAGEHHLTIYYLERGSSMSNCAIYFNIAPRYSMNLEKTDAATAEMLDGAEFSVYMDSACTIPAELWRSEDAFHDGEASINTFAISKGKGSIWGFSGGNTYYIKETKSPDGYTLPSGVIRMTLDNHGTATYDIDVIKDGDDVSDGFRVIGFRIDDVTHEIYLVISNRLEDTLDVTVDKVWDVDAEDEIPDSVEVYLEANGEKIGENISLSEENEWSYTWTGVPKKGEDGKQITYSVKEVPVPGYKSQLSQGEGIVSYIQWVPVRTLVDGETHLLVSGDNALTVTDTGTLKLIPTVDARGDTKAQWTAIENGLGFLMQNGEGNRLAFNTQTKKFYTTSGTDGLQEIHYNEQGVRVYYNEQAYYLDMDSKGTIGTASEDAGIIFELKERVTVEAIDFTVTNTPIGQQTYLEVTKVWDDGNEQHEEDSITVCLQADEVDTGVELVLNQENNWSGTFDGLPYYQDDGVTKIRYSVVEKEVRGYTTEYSEVTEHEMAYAVTVTNHFVRYELPVTGGMGTMPFYLLGAVFVMLSSVLFYNYKNKEKGRVKK